MTFDHIAIAVADLDAAIALWTSSFGLVCEHREDVPAQKVRVAFLRSGGPGARIELIQATDPGAGVARFLGERGAALHHVAFEVADLAGALAETPLPKVDVAPRPGAEGRQVAFLHPRATGGVLVEWVGEAGA
ncbi:MAG TPA: VOC family protein [Bacillota bacterium]|nr:VOC family protein [Bacillota bacterium]